jgi:hypothetical protein
LAKAGIFSFASELREAVIMSNSDLTSILFILLLLVSLAQLLGYLFVKLRQTKVIGEILAGVAFWPSVSP